MPSTGAWNAWPPSIATCCAAAVAELLGFPTTPRAVVINEALEIARKFSSPESVQFINGVLDSVGKELDKAKA